MNPEGKKVHKTNARIPSGPCGGALSPVVLQLDRERKRQDDRLESAQLSGPCRILVQNGKRLEKPIEIPVKLP